MGFPSLFTKVPRYQRFSYHPRYYDPDKEKQDLRKKKILDPQKEVTSIPDHATRLTGSFQAHRRFASKQREAKNKSVLLRFGLLLVLTAFVWSTLQWGKYALYAFPLILLIYLYIRLKKRRNSL